MANGTNGIYWSNDRQHHQFHHYHPGKSKFGEDRYFKITKTIYENLNDHLSNHNYLAGDYSIADIATFPWIARHNIHDIGLHHYLIYAHGMN